MRKNLEEKLALLRLIKDNNIIINIIKYLFYYFDLFSLIFIKRTRKKYKKKQVLLLANLGLGDSVNFLSVTDKYRKLYNKENYDITLIVTKGLGILFENETKFDKIIEVNFNECVFNVIKRIKLYKKINKENYDILIDAMGITGTAINMYICNIVNAKEKITIVNKSISNCPIFFLKRIYTKIYYLDNKLISNIDYYNYFYSLVSNNKKYEIKFHKIKDYKLNVELPSNYYIVFPGSSTQIKNWPIERYASIIKKIYIKTKLPVVFCGTLLDSEIINNLISLIDVPYFNIIGKTNVLEFIELIKKSKFIITNDTSSYHIAINEEVPVAIITGGYTYDNYVVYNFKNNKYKKPYIIVSKKLCFNCLCKCKYLKNGDAIWPCLNDITVDYAWNIIEKMIDKEM